FAVWKEPTKEAIDLWKKIDELDARATQHESDSRVAATAATVFWQIAQTLWTYPFPGSWVMAVGYAAASVISLAASKSYADQARTERAEAQRLRDQFNQQRDRMFKTVLKPTGVTRTSAWSGWAA